MYCLESLGLCHKMYIMRENERCKEKGNKIKGREREKKHKKERGKGPTWIHFLLYSTISDPSVFAIHCA